MVRGEGLVTGRGERAQVTTTIARSVMVVVETVQVGALVEGLDGFVKGTLEVGLVAIFSMVLGGRPERMLAGALPDVLDATVDQGKHALSRLHSSDTAVQL